MGPTVLQIVQLETWVMLRSLRLVINHKRFDQSKRIPLQYTLVLLVGISFSHHLSMLGWVAVLFNLHHLDLVDQFLLSHHISVLTGIALLFSRQQLHILFLRVSSLGLFFSARLLVLFLSFASLFNCLSTCILGLATNRSHALTALLVVAQRIPETSLTIHKIITATNRILAHY